VSKRRRSLRGVLGVVWVLTRSSAADKFPSAQVIGVDLSPIQPIWVPPNLQFVVDDIEDEWLHGSDWDLVHMRCISPWVKNMDKVLGGAFE
jgi:hypothetical protein